MGDPSGAYNLNEPQKRFSGSFSFGARPHSRTACWLKKVINPSGSQV
jgi:hypothetical protein